MTNGPTSITCKVNNNTLQNGNYSIIVGDENFLKYGAIRQKIEFFNARFCPNNCTYSKGHGECNYRIGQCKYTYGYFKSDCSVNYHTLGIIVVSITIIITFLVIITQGIIFIKHVKPQRYETPYKIHKNISNFLTIIGIPIELIQLVVFNLNTKSE